MTVLVLLRGGVFRLFENVHHISPVTGGVKLEDIDYEEIETLRADDVLKMEILEL